MFCLAAAARGQVDSACRTRWNGWWWPMITFLSFCYNVFFSYFFSSFFLSLPGRTKTTIMHHIKHNVRPFIPDAIIFYVYFRYLATVFEWAQGRPERGGWGDGCKKHGPFRDQYFACSLFKRKEMFQSKIDVNETSVSAKGLGNCH